MENPLPAAIETPPPDPRGEAEARRIYAAIFGHDIPRVVLQRFMIASRRLDASVQEAERQAYHRALSASRDLEALEIGARLAGRLPLLTRKFRLMVYLAETVPDNHAFFVNERASLVVGLARSAKGVIRTAFKVTSWIFSSRRIARA